MAQKLWEKSVQVNKDIERFTVGRDREMDLYLAKHDVLGSMAHITMLESIGLLTKEELEQLLAELKTIYASAERGEFIIEEGVEDVHSQVELMLTRRLGDVGKKIHSGRSRNDQVLLDLKLFTRTQIREIADPLDCGSVLMPKAWWMICSSYKRLSGCAIAILWALQQDMAPLSR